MEEDRRYGELLVRMGLCSKEQVDSGLREVERRLAEGGSPAPSLSGVLLERGVLSPVQAQSTLRLPEPLPARPAAPEPDEVAEAAAVPENRAGKYVKVSALGRGGMGEVWKAWDRELCRWAALKFLHQEDSEQLARFRREAQMAARLSHPNIAAVYEVGQTGGKQFIAMQFVPGATLASGGRRPPRLVVELLRDAALAIHYAHEQGTIHRDLKPANLMVVEESPRPRIFVLDFGLARPAAGDSSVSVTGIVVGTPSYMSPEQARAESHRVGPISDIYGLGATLYELLAGVPPFFGGDAYSVLEKVVNEDPPRIRARAPEIDADLETIVLKCLEKEPERRYESARALADDLSRWLAGEAILARRPSVAYRVRKFIARRKGIVIASAAGAVAVAATLGVLVPAWRESRERERTAAIVHAKEIETAARRQGFLNDLSASWSEVVRAREWIRQPFRKPQEIRREFLRTLEAIDALVGAHPEFPQGYYVRARVRLGLMDLDGAEADLREALRRMPDLSPAWSLLARVKLEQELLLRYHSQYSQTEEEARRAEAFSREREEALRRMATLRPVAGTWLPRLTEDDIHETLSRAMRAAFLEKDGASAHNTVKQEFDKSPSEEYARFLGIWSATAAERRRWCDEAVRIAPHFAAARFDRGVMRVDEQDLKGAIEDYTHALEFRPENALAYNNRGTARARLADLAGALKDFDEAVRLAPRMAVARYNRAKARDRAGNVAAALEDYTEAIALHPGYVDALRSRGVLRAMRRDAAGAKEDLERAVSIAPKDATVRFDRARVLRQLGDAKGAVEEYTKVVALDPRRTEAWINRGNLWMELQQPERGFQDYSEAIRVDPKLAAAYRMRASCWILKGEHRRAEEDLTRCIELDPSSAVAFANRGVARMSLGNARGAVADLEQAFKIAPADWTHAEQFRAILREAREKAKD
jgi:tetratricopeptide (TPR) repeat protein